MYRILLLGYALFAGITIPFGDNVSTEIKRGYEPADDTPFLNLTRIARLDSIEYPQDAVIEKDRMFVTGYTFTGPNTRYSMVACVNLTNGKVEWTKVFDPHPTVELIHLSIIDGRLYVSGSGGISGVVKDSKGKKTGDPIDLNVMVVSMSLDGKEMFFKEIERDNATFLCSAIVQYHGKLFMTYSDVNANDWRDITSTQTKIVELSNKLDVVRSHSFANEFTTRQQLVSSGDRLRMIALHNRPNQLVAFEFNEHLDAVSYPLQTDIYEFNYACIPENAKLRVVSIGNTQKDGHKVNVISRFEFANHAWTKGSQSYFTHKDGYISDQFLGILQGKVIAYTRDTLKHYSLTAFDGTGMNQRTAFTREDTGDLSLEQLLFDAQDAPFFVATENSRTVVCKIAAMQ